MSARLNPDEHIGRKLLLAANVERASHCRTEDTLQPRSKIGRNSHWLQTSSEPLSDRGYHPQATASLDLLIGTFSLTCTRSTGSTAIYINVVQLDSVGGGTSPRQLCTHYSSFNVPKIHIVIAKVTMLCAQAKVCQLSIGWRSPVHVE